MRAIISPSGSFIAIAPPSLPARLDQARDQPLGAEIPKRDARQPVLAVEAAWPARYLATIANPGPRRIARQFRQLERCREPLLHRLALVASNGLEPSAPPGIFLAELAPPVVLLDRTFLSHQCLLAFRRCGRFLLPERKIERAQQRSRLVVGFGAGTHGNVHPPDIGHLVVVDLGEDDVFLDADRVIASAVEALRRQTAEIARARQRDVDQPVDELVHASLAQRHLAADRLAVAYFAGGNRLSGLVGHRLLAGTSTQIVAGGFGRLSLVHHIVAGHT